MPEWKPVPGYEGWYEVSDAGDVRRVMPARGGQVGKVLAPRVYANGRRCVLLCKEHKIQTLSLPRLVAETFIGPCPDRHEVDHVNGDPNDNRVSNLEYVTSSENKRRAIRTGLVSRVLTDAQADEVFVMYDSGLSQAKIAAKFGVSQPLISGILRGVMYVDRSAGTDTARARLRQEKLRNR